MFVCMDVCICACWCASASQAEFYAWVWQYFWSTHCKTIQITKKQHTTQTTSTLQHTATHCNTLQDTATHCNTLQDTTTHCNTLQHARGDMDFRHSCIHESFDAVRTDLSATRCNTLKHTAKHNTYWSDRHVKILDSPVLIPSAGSISQKSVL